MKSPHSALAPLLRSNLQGDLLAVLLLNPDKEYSLTELTDRIGGYPSAVHREVERLVDSGLLLDRRVGRTRVIRANTKARLYKPTRSMIEVTYGPKVVIENELSGKPGVDQAYVFGSWASRYLGNDGPEPNDIDVLVVGDLSRRKMAEIAENLTDLTHQEVNFERVSADTWAAAVDPFVKTVKDKPLVKLDLEGTHDS